MAAYFTAPRFHAPPVPSSPEQQSLLYRDDPFDVTESDPTYIFPNPSSAPPSPSPSQFSILPEHSDISVSVVSFSEFGSLEASPVVTQREYYPARPTSRQFVNTPLNSWTDIQGTSWDLKNSPRLDSIRHDAHMMPSHHPHGRTPNGEVSIPAPNINSGAAGAGFCHPPARSLTRSKSLILEKEELQFLLQQGRSLLRESGPLFTFLSSLLSADESTLDLLAEPTSSSSIFFPIDTRSGTDTWNETETFTAPHGLEKLFSAIAAEKGHRTIHQGIRIFGDIPSSEVNFAPLSGIWIVVTGILSNGCKILSRLSGNLPRRMPGMD